MTKHVYLPLQRIERCEKCNATTNLKFCACKQVLYCSTACQNEHWSSTHKKDCGLSDIVSLDTKFYPFLARLSHDCHMIFSPQHPAITREILNSPNPGSPATVLPDGRSKQLIILGEMLNPGVMAPDLSTWWPTGLTPPVRKKMLRRFQMEGHVLPIVTSIAFALLSQMYTTTSDSSKKSRRVRLGYRSSPIADFGIAKGKFKVVAQDSFLYWNLEENTFTEGQDAENHYWLWFTTVRGEELILDFNVYTFNLCTMVANANGYRVPTSEFIGGVPVFFYERVLERNLGLPTHTERSRRSILRDPSLQQAAIHPYWSGEGDHVPEDLAETILSWMESFSDRLMPEEEKRLTMFWTGKNCKYMHQAVVHRSWNSWPKEPVQGLEPDPQEMIDTPEEAESWRKFKKLVKKRKRGDISEDQSKEAYRKLRASNN